MTSTNFRRRSPRLRTVALCTLILTGVATAALLGTPTMAQNAVVAPGSLAREPRPEPSNLGEFVSDKTAAIALGKALFWDTRVGSDGKTACATCHFNAGADSRSTNQLSPGFHRLNSGGFDIGGPNITLKADEFPFHSFSKMDDANSAVKQSASVVFSSQGVFKTLFQAVTPGQAVDTTTPVPDPVFKEGGTNLRRVEPRNSPTVINAVFNLRQFWDGRAQTFFNGATPFGRRDAQARVFKSSMGNNPLNKPNPASALAISIDNASLASQASGPPVSDFEMSATGRAFPDVGRKMLPMRPLAGQVVAPDDSVLGRYRGSRPDGLDTADYAAMVRLAFKPEWWNANQNVTVNGRPYAQMEANFSLYFGLAVQLYQATLVSDQTPYDKFADGDSKALGNDELKGFGVFMGKGKCVSCHGGAAFTNAAIRVKQPTTERISRMIMGNGQLALYDEGFYNIGVTRTGDDPGVGDKDPWGRPLSFSRLAQINSGAEFYRLEGQSPNVNNVSATERVAVQGAFKTPTLRNVELTAPYFHNGGVAKLKDVVEFYNRGGNFARENRDNLDVDIQPLGLKGDEIDQLVAFMKALTDERVRQHAAPFDHPSLDVPNGHAGNKNGVFVTGRREAQDQMMLIPAVGKNGYAKDKQPDLFLKIKQ